MLMGKTILKNLLQKYSTRLHPVEQRVLPNRYRGRFKFVIEKCILCRACALKCPTQCITIDPETGLWERSIMGCVYCGVCADACPTGCIIMTNVYRPPITEPTNMRFMCTPRPKKKAAKKDADATKQTATKDAEVLEAIREKQGERIETILPPAHD